jgi:hypothetical protein
MPPVRGAQYFRADLEGSALTQFPPCARRASLAERRQAKRASLHRALAQPAASGFFSPCSGGRRLLQHPKRAQFARLKRVERADDHRLSASGEVEGAVLRTMRHLTRSVDGARAPLEKRRAREARCRAALARGRAPRSGNGVARRLRLAIEGRLRARRRVSRARSAPRGAADQQNALCRDRRRIGGDDLRRVQRHHLA